MADAISGRIETNNEKFITKMDFFFFFSFYLVECTLHSKYHDICFGWTALTHTECFANKFENLSEIWNFVFLALKRFIFNRRHKYGYADDEKHGKNHKFELIEKSPKNCHAKST